MTTAMNIYDAKAHFSKIISEVERTGIHVVIYRHKIPVAEIVPLRSKTDPLVSDPALKGATFSGDPTAPLSAEDWPEAIR